LLPLPSLIDHEAVMATSSARVAAWLPAALAAEPDHARG